MDAIRIQDRPIGPGHPAFLIAELSANHLQDLEIALQTIRAAADCGADAVKLQTYTPDTITLDCRRECFLIRQDSPWKGMYLYDLYRQAFTPWDWQERLFAEARRLGLVCFASVFDPSSVDFLEPLGCPAYKIASFEIGDLPLIGYAASRKKPVLLSTGIATQEEIGEAMEVCRAAGNPQIALLKCTSAYPAPLESVHLRTMADMAARFDVPVGVSDHTLGCSVAVASVALGACIVEKHLILRKSLGGPDAAFSIEPEEFRAMARGIREVEKALGCATYELTPGQVASRSHARSLFAVADIRAGEPLTRDNVRSIRPADGLPPRHLTEILGRKACIDIPRGTPLQWEMIEPPHPGSPLSPSPSDGQEELP